jgi:hypothetical protein
LIDPLDFAALVDPVLHGRSGSVFYTGRAAFARKTPLYILGLNPGGSPEAQADETIGRDLVDWEDLPERWSAYKDESWNGAPAGTWGMQPRMLHMFEKLGLNPHHVPASNVVFVRSNGEAALAHEKAVLLRQCWPVHQAVIERLGASTILCLGSTAGKWIRDYLGATALAGRFSETNARGWTSEAHLNASNVCVLTVTHPGRADWRNPAADPTPLVREMLAR